MRLNPGHTPPNVCILSTPFLTALTSVEVLRKCKSCVQKVNTVLFIYNSFIYSPTSTKFGPDLDELCIQKTFDENDSSFKK